MIKDKVFASTLYQTAYIKRTVTTYDNKYNRPETTVETIEYPCRVTRKSNGYLVLQDPKNQTQSNFRGYFEIDADISSGDLIVVDDMKYKVGLVYKPMNHHIEVDLTTSLMEA